MTKIIHIAIADDHLVFRQGLIELLKNFEEIKVIFDVSNGREALNKIKEYKPDILLLDIQMPEMQGLDVLEKVKIKYPTVKTIILTSHFSEAYIQEFIRKGAAGFLSKNTDIEKIVDTIHSVHANGYHFDSKVSLVMAKIINQNAVISDSEINIPGISLTQREVKIIKLICQNTANKEIAEKLNLSIRTVEGHRLNIRKKTGCKTTIDFIKYAMEHNFEIQDSNH